MLFGWLVESGITSNSVIYVKDLATVGIGTGEQDRVGVAEIARDKAYRKLADRICFEKHATPYNEMKDLDARADIDQAVAEANGGLIGAAMVSDAFFPFRDGIDVGINEKISCVVQPGGSANDYQSIEACNEAGCDHGVYGAAQLQTLKLNVHCTGGAVHIYTNRRSSAQHSPLRANCLSPYVLWIVDLR